MRPDLARYRTGEEYSVCATTDGTLSENVSDGLTESLPPPRRRLDLGGDPVSLCFIDGDGSFSRPIKGSDASATTAVGRRRSAGTTPRRFSHYPLTRDALEATEGDPRSGLQALEAQVLIGGAQRALLPNEGVPKGVTLGTLAKLMLCSINLICTSGHP